MDPKWFNCLLGIFSLVVIITGCYMNIIVLLFFARKRHLRTPTNLLLVNLSVSNMIALVFVLPPNLANLNESFEFKGGFCDFTGLVTHVWWFSNVYTLMFLSYDYWKYISCPFVYVNVMTATKTYVFIAMTWMVAFVFSLFPILGRPSYVFQAKHTCMIDWEESVVFNMVFVSIGFCLPWIVMLVCHVCIILYARTIRRIGPMPSRDHQRRTEGSRHRFSTCRVIQKCFVILGTFLLAWLPQFALILLVSFHAKKIWYLAWLQKFAHALTFLPVVLYPYVLVFRDVILGQKLRRFKKGFCLGNVRDIQPSSHIDINDYSENISRRNSRSELSEAESSTSRKNSLSTSLRDWRSAKQNSCILSIGSRRESHESTLTNVYF